MITLNNFVLGKNLPSDRQLVLKDSISGSCFEPKQRKLSQENVHVVSIPSKSANKQRSSLALASDEIPGPCGIWGWPVILRFQIWLVSPQQFLDCFKQLVSLYSQSWTCHELNSFIPRLSPALETKIQVQIRIHYCGREFCGPCMSLGRWIHSLSPDVSREHSIWFIRSIIETDKPETNTCYICLPSWLLSWREKWILCQRHCVANARHPEDSKWIVRVKNSAIVNDKSQLKGKAKIQG